MHLNAGLNPQSFNILRGNKFSNWVSYEYRRNGADTKKLTVN